VTRSQKRMIVSRRVPSNRGLAAVEIIQQNFGVKVMEQWAIRCSIRSSPSLVDRTPVGLDPLKYATHSMRRTRRP
jgi:hypothetical protein